MKKRSKYGAEKEEVDGIIFDSKVEAKYYLALKKDKAYGNIRDFKLQPEFILQPGFKRDGKSILPIKLKADFHVYLPSGAEEIIDIKGFPTSEALLKRKMFMYRFPDKKLTWITYVQKHGGWIEFFKLKAIRAAEKKRKKNS